MAGRADPGFDLGAAVTRSLLGWGVVAGVFYLLVGVTLGLRRDGFSFIEHPLSLLMLGDFGWVQATNLILAVCMVVAAGVGSHRAMSPDRRARRTGVLLSVYGVALIGSGIFPPDPVEGFPHPDSVAVVTTSGILHLAWGAAGFIALSGAAFFVAAWHAGRVERSRALRSRGSGILVAVGFVGGAALAASNLGVALLWLAVVVGWAWLSATSLYLYRIVAHPDLDRRSAAGADTTGVG